MKRIFNFRVSKKFGGQHTTLTNLSHGHFYHFLLHFIHLRVDVEVCTVQRSTPRAKFVWTLKMPFQHHSLSPVF